MKKVRLLTLAAVATTASLAFTSCGGGDAASDEKGKETKENNEGGDAGQTASAGDYDMTTGLGQVKFLVNSIQNGGITIDKTNQEEVQAFFNFEDKYFEEGDDRLSDQTSMAGYKLSKSYTFYKTQLNMVSYDTYYDDNAKDKVEGDFNEIKDYIVSVFGEAESRKYPEWETDKFKLKISDYDSGYRVDFESVTIDKYEQDRLDAIVEGEASTKVNELLAAVLDGSLVVKSISNTDFAAWSGIEANDYYMDDKIQYVDHYLKRNVDVDNGVISKIEYRVSEDVYDYNNEPQVEENLAASITTTLGADYVESGKVKTWTKDGYTISVENDYGITIIIE